MVQRDYATRGRTKPKKKTNRVNKGLLLIIAAAIVAVFAAGLYLLKEKSIESGIVANPEKVEENNKPKSTLPSRPEEVWSYIRDLETREIPVDNSQKSLDKVQNLTEEQKRILQLLERDAQVTEVAKVDKNVGTQQPATTPQAAAQQTAAVSPVTPPEKAKEQSVKATEKAEIVQAKPQTEKKTIAKTPSSTTAPTTTAAITTAKFGLQCGAFKNRQQAENLQAKLVMAGFDARISSSANWNRIFIGPLGDRATANSGLQKAKSVAECVVIGM
ncbi:cell division protein FtsN [Testudinibacter sp. TR-2022]|uniref:cell division protein FtsN n=1 Tax=Testudinibacter sp. TR-2022 TaxID=2585029 RepID=UPI001119F582|nr:cell division protein FtsN [Testudinibacter sp. TR-2022]TNH04866.1 cell division protein FtsN [Pasteurellaceae bacterium Phil31]TNH08285.1 cell division protein FtsN [Testudinibacter sp. TR-2022]TNH11184.1 cell division protein FtsN [Testudinibacter sp. TR-2022]TNH11795.1 cell division protein FtsN [Testudinibacter sp. TR-2022]TNH18325.1 cell division protein FtsN [Testudinibacter sp. TR-2022]